ncbi:protein kinase domain-containing protein [Nonomuraea roseoviolacea]|uniref:non-specific serine/threonine protein kinase n=1 Tax=Nonomuraea roseoviolacea subsp. carminata TaxID=160689 RepID=A0ABT1K174_9ACTN|nr:serine/threonine-protein kinase [Nonomuraea roseoviolacea]MCP2347605.1 serine/threonine protein kinase [Nonomuraea roseoviolacea subsp. carminata]
MSHFLGRYRLDPLRLGCGGMGEVWGADDIVLDRRVAIKFVLLPDEELHQRFTREAKALSSLAHPGVPALYDFGTVDGRHYMVMQFIDGNGLHDVIAEHAPLSIGWVASIGAQIATVLEAAHEQGILHRDLKPSNLMLCRDGSIRVLDFGLAFIHDADMTMLTQTGQQLGTAAYMSPEQVEGKRSTKHADIYSLGCVLYEAATGHRLFTGPNDYSVKTQHVTTSPVPAGRHRADIPRGLDELLMAMVEKDPADRPGSVREVYERLMPYLSGTAPLGDMTDALPSPLTLYARALSRTTMTGPALPATESRAVRDDFSHGDARRARRNAQTLIRESRYTEATSMLEEALTRTPDAPGLREQLAEAYMGAGDYRRAAQGFSELAASSEPGQAFHYRLQEATCHAQLGDVDLALHLLTALVADVPEEDDPQALELRRQIGELELSSGFLERARRTLTALLSDLERIYGTEHAATERVRQLLTATR